MKPFRLTRRALGSAVCMTLLAGTVLFYFADACSRSSSG